MENLTCESYYGSGPTKRAECCNGVRLVSKNFASVVRDNIPVAAFSATESLPSVPDSSRRFFASHPSNDNVVFANGSEIYHHEPISSIGLRSNHPELSFSQKGASVVVATRRGISWLTGSG